MIVSKDEARRILQGRKTTHRVLAKDGRDCSFVVGRDYAISTMADRDPIELYGFTSNIVAKPGKTRRRRQRVPRESCRIVVTDVVESTLAAVDVTAARGEGFRTSGDFYAYWCQRHGAGPHDPRTRVWVLTFHVLRETDDRVRLLALRSENGYTADHRSALPDEPEAVDETTTSRYARAAFERDDQTRRAMPLELRLSMARAAARDRRVDISTHERVIADRVERIERTIYPDTEAAA